MSIAEHFVEVFPPERRLTQLVLFVVSVHGNSPLHAATVNLRAMLQACHVVELALVHQFKDHLVQVIVQPVPQNFLGFFFVSTYGSIGNKFHRLKGVPKG